MGLVTNKSARHDYEKDMFLEIVHGDLYLLKDESDHRSVITSPLPEINMLFIL